MCAASALSSVRLPDLPRSPLAKHSPSPRVRVVRVGRQRWVKLRRTQPEQMSSGAPESGHCPMQSACLKGATALNRCAIARGGGRPACEHGKRSGDRRDAATRRLPPARANSRELLVRLSLGRGGGRGGGEVVRMKVKPNAREKKISGVEQTKTRKHRNVMLPPTPPNLIGRPHD